MLRKFILGIMILSLYACSSTHPRNLKSTGKLNYYTGQYTAAFAQLLPLAKDGDPDAQYAVGYMYYYGQGVKPDFDQAVIWFERAAKQNNYLAIRALAQIQEMQ